MKLRKAALLASVIAVATIALALLFSRHPQSPVLPSPNGYDDLLAVAPSIVPNPGNWRTQDLAELRRVLAPNSNALMTIRGALHKEWAVPVFYATNHDLAMSNLVAAKALAQLFCAEGRMAELEHRTNEALNAFTECIQLGQKCTHGALMIQNLVGIACKAIGMQAAQTVYGSADSASLQMFLKRLAEIDESNQSPDEVIRRDHQWNRSSLNAFQSALVSLVLRSTLRKAEGRMRARHLRSEAEVRLLRTDVALELFRRQTGRYPGKLADLVPKYLEAAPIDPFTGKPVLYRLTTNSYLLYSIGPDRKDDGGKPLSRADGTFEINGVSLEQGDLISTPPPGW